MMKIKKYLFEARAAALVSSLEQTKVKSDLSDLSDDCLLVRHEMLLASREGLSSLRIFTVSKTTKKTTRFFPDRSFLWKKNLFLLAHRFADLRFAAFQIGVTATTLFDLVVLLTHDNSLISLYD